MYIIITILFIIVTILSIIVFDIKGLLSLLITVPLIIMYIKSNNIIDIIKKEKRGKDKYNLSERKEVDFVSSRDRKKAVKKEVFDLKKENTEKKEKDTKKKKDTKENKKVKENKNVKEQKNDKNRRKLEDKKAKMAFKKKAKNTNRREETKKPK